MRPARHFHGCVFAAAGCATSIVVVLVIGVVVLRTNFTRHTQSAANMEPTIAKGDTVIVRVAHAITRGDVVSFVMPTSGGLALKRVVALPGKTVELREGVAVVNGAALDEPYIVLREGPEPEIPVVRDMAAEQVPPDHFFFLGRQP